MPAQLRGEIVERFDGKELASVTVAALTVASLGTLVHQTSTLDISDFTPKLPLPLLWGAFPPG